MVWYLSSYLSIFSRVVLPRSPLLIGARPPRSLSQYLRYEGEKERAERATQARGKARQRPFPRFTDWLAKRRLAAGDLRPRWMAATWKVFLHEVVLLPGLRASFATINCEYLDPRRHWPFLHVDADVQCWSGPHLIDALVAFVSIVYSYVTAVAFAARNVADREKLQPEKHFFAAGLVIEVVAKWAIAGGDFFVGAYNYYGSGRLCGLFLLLVAWNRSLHIFDFHPARGVGWGDTLKP